MRFLQRVTILACWLTMAHAAGAQHVAQGRVLLGREPGPNLGQLKTKLIAYHDCVKPGPCYATELNGQTALATAFLKRRAASAKRGEKLALVLDIDETSLSNWQEEKRSGLQSYTGKVWDAWVKKKEATAIPGTLALYNEARKNGVFVFFITGRGEAQRADTSENLKSAGYNGWTGLALRGAHASGQTTEEYKSAEREKIADAGYRLILNVGDQLSDFLNGNPQAELSSESCPIPSTLFREAVQETLGL